MRISHTLKTHIFEATSKLNKYSNEKVNYYWYLTCISKFFQSTKVQRQTLNCHLGIYLKNSLRKKTFHILTFFLERFHSLKEIKYHGSFHQKDFWRTDILTWNIGTMMLFSHSLTTNNFPDLANKLFVVQAICILIFLLFCLLFGNFQINTIFVLDTLPYSIYSEFNQKSGYCKSAILEICCISGTEKSNWKSN